MGAVKAPTERFSDRVSDYVKYRPSYPQQLIQTLCAECNLGPRSVAVDVGAGTGIFSALLLEAGMRVVAVEPNESMRRAAEEKLAAHPHFTSRPGSAERTGLDAGSADLLTAAQAFHWFRRDEARREFGRILRPGGWVALIWNQRNTRTPFLAAYEKMLQTYAPDYAASAHRDEDPAAIEAFYGPMGCRRFVFPSVQQLDLEGLRGRLMSSSYAPKPGHAQHAPMMRHLDALFALHEREGQVAFHYDTILYLGGLS